MVVKVGGLPAARGLDCVAADPVAGGVELAFALQPAGGVEIGQPDLVDPDGVPGQSPRARQLRHIARASRACRAPISVASPSKATMAPMALIRKNGLPWKADCPAAFSRNEPLRASGHYGRAFWKRWTGYHARSRIEAKMRCLNAFGEGIAARDPDRQTAEIRIRIALMNRFSALGTAEIVPVALFRRGKGLSCRSRESRNNADGFRRRRYGSNREQRGSALPAIRYAVWPKCWSGPSDSLIRSCMSPRRPASNRGAGAVVHAGPAPWAGPLGESGHGIHPLKPFENPDQMQKFINGYLRQPIVPKVIKT